MILILSLVLILILAYTIYSLTNHDQLYNDSYQLASSTPASQLESEDKSLGFTIWVFFLGGALMTGAFAVQFFAGSDSPADFTTTQWLYAGIGCIVTLGITLAQKILYSSINTTKAGLLITALILLFVIFSEIATSSERTDLLVKYRSQNSETYKSTLVAINAPTVPANTNIRGIADAQAELADAQYELSRCDRHAAKGQKRVEKCEVHETKRIKKAQGRITAIQTQNQIVVDAAAETKLKMIDKAKGMEYDETQSPAIVRFMKSLLGGAMLQNMILASLIIVIAFESGFHFTGTRRAVIRHALLLKQGHHEDIHVPGAAPSRMDNDPVQRATNNTTDLAEHQVRTQQSQKQPIGFINPNAAPPNPERRVTQGQAKPHTQGHVTSAEHPNHRRTAPDKKPLIGKADMQLDIPQLLTRETDNNITPNFAKERFFKLLYTEIRNQVLNGDTPPIVRPVTDAVSNLIQEKADLLQIRSSMIGKPQRQQIAQLIILKLDEEGIVCRNTESGIGKPKYVLAPKYAQMSTYNRELADHGIPSPADKALDQAADKADIERIIAKGQRAASDPASPCAQGHAGSTTQGKEAVAKMPPNLYEQWKTAIESEALPRTSTASRKWIQQQIAGSQTAKATPTLKEITLVSNAFFAHACASSDSRINIKPGYKNGQKEKYILTDAPCVLTA